MLPNQEVICRRLGSERDADVACSELAVMLVEPNWYRSLGCVGIGYASELACLALRTQRDDDDDRQDDDDGTVDYSL